MTLTRLISLEDARETKAYPLYKRAHITLLETGKRPISLPMLKPSSHPWDLSFDVRQSEMVEFVVRLDFDDASALMEFHLIFDRLVLEPHELAADGHRIRSAALREEIAETERQVRLWLQGS